MVLLQLYFRGRELLPSEAAADLKLLARAERSWVFHVRGEENFVFLLATTPDRSPATTTPDRSPATTTPPPRLATTAASSPSRPAAPLLGYFFHPSVNLPPPFPPKTDIMRRPAVFAPLDLYSPRLSLRLAPGAASGLSIRDVHLGLVLLLPTADDGPVTSLPRVLVVDPASRRRELLPPPPRTARAPADKGRQGGL
ncbi:hypothetical protein EJB05_53098, partial [Eragrostis curvula]